MQISCRDLIPWRALITSILVLLTGVLGVSGAQAQSFKITKTAFEGLRTLDATALLGQLGRTQGGFSAQEISEAGKKIYSTGFFESVQAVVRDGSTLVFRVQEKPRVRKTFIRGNKNISDSSLSEDLTFDATRYYDRTKATALAKKAVGRYQREGYLDAAVVPSAVPSAGEEGYVDVTFTVSEGERFSIDEVRVEGLQEVDEDEVLQVIETRPYTWYKSWLTGSGRLNEEMAENDKTIIRQFLLDRGYLESSVAGPRTDRHGKKLSLVFEVKEGQQYKIGDIVARGDLLDGSAAATLEGIASRSGEIFNLSDARKDTFAIAERFGNQGYAFANVTPDTRLHPESATVDLSFDVAKGEQVTVNKINIRGNEKTYENVIRREVRLAEQEQYSSAQVKKSEEWLRRTGYFQEASVTTQATNDPKKVDLNVNVKEANTGTFSIGAGYSTSDGFIINGRVSELNLLGTGRRLDLNADIGAIRNNLSLMLEDRRLFDSRTFVAIEGGVTERLFLDFDRRLTGGGIAIGHPLDFLGEWGEYITTSLKYQFYNVDIFNVESDAAQFVRDAQGSTSAGSLVPRIIRDTLDNPINPNRGSRQVLLYEHAGVGGDEKFSLFEARNTWYQPLVTTKKGDITLSWRVSYARGEADGDDPFPLFKRYFPGGINSVRGYEARTLGPVDANGKTYGGSSEFVTNFDLIFPLMPSAGVRGVLFYDLGDAFDDGQSVQFGDLRKAYGFGVRWNSPMGPLRVEFGFPGDKRDGEDGMQTMFSFGAPL